VTVTFIEGQTDCGADGGVHAGRRRPRVHYSDVRRRVLSERCMGQKKTNKTKNKKQKQKCTEGAWKWGLGRAKVTKAAWESMNC
jgi:hypothetical protein